MASNQTDRTLIRSHLRDRDGNEGVLLEDHVLYVDCHPCGDNPKPRRHWRMGERPADKPTHDVVLSNDGTVMVSRSGELQPWEYQGDLPSRAFCVTDRDGSSYDIRLNDVKSVESRTRVGAVEAAIGRWPYSATVTIFYKGHRVTCPQPASPMNSIRSLGIIHSGLRSRYPNIALIEGHSFLANFDVFSTEWLGDADRRIDWLLSDALTAPESRSAFILEPHQATSHDRPSGIYYHEWHEGVPREVRWPGPQSGSTGPVGQRKDTGQITTTTESDGRQYTIEGYRDYEAPADRSIPSGFHRYRADALMIYSQ